MNRVENSKLLRSDTQTNTQITTQTTQNLPETWVGVGWQSNRTPSKDHNSLTIEFKYIEVSERPGEDFKSFLVRMMKIKKANINRGHGILGK